LKGNIRVFCRIRPLLPREKGEDFATHKRDAFTAEVIRDHLSADGMRQKIEKRGFSFDAVFGVSSAQEEVFREVKDLVQSAVDGYNVTILAYGQTGAGKTYTMYGGAGDQRGVAPRTIEAIFEVLNQFDERRFQTTVRVNMVELYRNDLVDLLTAQSSASKLEVKRDCRDGKISIENVEERIVRDKQELLRILQEGSERRHVAATEMNMDSSRSHLFLNINIEVYDIEVKTSVTGKIRLGDLAGSERPKKSGASGDVLKEAIEINKSLTALGDVIEALTKGSKGPVPYRNHKLTLLLSDSIGGDAKTLMFVNVSCAKSELEETQNSLMYASRARGIVNDTQKPGATRAASASVGRSEDRVGRTLRMEECGDESSHSPAQDRGDRSPAPQASSKDAGTAATLGGRKSR